ncbi:hypothetical protein GCM10010191_87630 [Actinomadura vinacea]|uniref:Uncharacterized protein n=1 Tax=Actinomadura vinacea TaxID=115336 RepID=A0ABN3KBH2_9ACTN
MSIHRQISALISTEAAHGTISAQRTSRRPGNRALSSCASGSESTTVAATTPTTQSTVRNRTPGRSVSSKRSA